MSAARRARRKGVTFQTRLSLSVAGLLFFALSLLSVLSGVVLWRVILRDLDETLREQYAVVARAASEQAQFRRGDLALPDSLLGVLTAGSDVVDARVEGQGYLSWESDFRDMPAALSLGFSDLGGWRLLRGQEGDLTVQVGRPLASSRATLSAYVRTSVPLVLLLSVLGGAVAWWLMGRGLRPLSILARRVKRLDADDAIPSVERADEVGALARALDVSLTGLRRQRAAERAFVARASHELRTPVAALQAELELALSRPRDADAYRAALRSARRSAAHLERLAVNLLTLTRLEGTSPRLARVDLWEIAADAVDRLLPLALQKNLTLDLSGQPTFVRGDSVLLARLLDNLLQNAIRYTHQGGVNVLVDAAPEGHFVTVEDSGVGFPEDLLRREAHLFEGEGQQGFGVGLSVIHSVARAHHAELLIEPRAQGGTRVTVRFPPLSPEVGA